MGMSYFGMRRLSGHLINWLYGRQQKMVILPTGSSYFSQAMERQSFRSVINKTDRAGLQCEVSCYFAQLNESIDRSQLTLSDVECVLNALSAFLRRRSDRLTERHTSECI
jgi:hypothetical protein